jgi:hypothetical protein
MMPGVKVAPGSLYNLDFGARLWIDDLALYFWRATPRHISKPDLLSNPLVVRVEDLMGSHI